MELWESTDSRSSQAEFIFLGLLLAQQQEEHHRSLEASAAPEQAQGEDLRSRVPSGRTKNPNHQSESFRSLWCPQDDWR